MEKIDIKFPRNGHGHVDLNDGVYDDERRNTSHVKYPNELRMCFGVASVDYGDGVRHGVGCKVFD